MFVIVVDIGVVVTVNGFDTAGEEGHQGVVLFLCHVIGDALSAAVEHADTVAELHP